MLTVNLLLTCSSFALPCEIMDLGLDPTADTAIWFQDPVDSEVEEEENVDDQELEDEEEKLTPAEAAELLETALKSRELDLIFSAIDEAGRISGKEVIKQLAKAAKHKDPEIRLDTLKALRFNEDPEATKALLKLKKSKPIVEHELCAEAYFLALGQKADVKALPILTDKLHVTNRNDKPTRARILAIGRIRDVKSVEALIALMNSGAGGRRGGRSHPNMKEINLCLQILTGADVRSNRDDWQAWWNDNKKSLKITKKEQEATTKKARGTWKMLWADPEDAEIMKEALKRGKTDFADADEEELEKLREKAEARKKGGKDDEEEEKDDDDSEKLMR